MGKGGNKQRGELKLPRLVARERPGSRLVLWALQRNRSATSERLDLVTMNHRERVRETCRFFSNASHCEATRLRLV
jgi:hypothetical protein